MENYLIAVYRLDKDLQLLVNIVIFISLFLFKYLHFNYLRAHSSVTNCFFFNSLYDIRD